LFDPFSSCPDDHHLFPVSASMSSWEYVDMSATISIRPPARAPHRNRVGIPAPAGSAATRLASEATYRRRRAVVGTILAVLIAVTAVLAHDVLAGSGGVPASAAESQPALVRRTITAQPGDTLWSIGKDHHGSVSLTRYVDKLVDLNGGASIQAGQAVLLP
jgi:LysM repeat protein